MSERFTSDLIFILVVLLIAALIGFLIGYFLRKYKHRKYTALEEEINRLKEICNRAQEETAHLKDECDKTKEEILLLKSKVDELSLWKQSFLSVPGDIPEVVFDDVLAAQALGYKFAENDLKIIEGIGEKIESILKSSGIDSWIKLSHSDPVKIKEILLEVGGPRYQMHEPGTWPKQALLACTGKWDELKQYQDELNAGR
jgi:septation ring formation regulator EzrA